MQTDQPTDQIVAIDVSSCIGCTKCIKACPVDAIVGAENLLHHVLKDECIGCRLCIDPCPVDCITVIDYQHKQPKHKRALHAKARLSAHKSRLEKSADRLKLQSQQRKSALPTPVSQVHSRQTNGSDKADASSVTRQKQQALAIKRLKVQIQKTEKALTRTTGDKTYGKTLLENLRRKLRNIKGPL